MKKILAVITETYPAPTETFIYRDLSELQKRGTDMVLLHLRSGTGTGPDGMDARRIPSLFNIFLLPALVLFIWKVRKSFFSLIRKTGRGPENGLKRLYHLLKAAHAARLLYPKRERYHIHAAFASLPAFYARTASALLNIPYTVSAHARDVLVETGGLADNLNCAELIIFCTEAVMKETCSRYKGISEKSACIYHGLRIRDCGDREFTGSGLRVCAAGRFVEKKGFEHLFRACSVMKKNGADILCTIAGHGPLLKRYTELVSDLDLADSVEFPGFLDCRELKALWHKSDVICVPSVRAQDGDMDGIPNVILEAGMHRVPAVVSDLPGICEAVEDGYNGFCVQAGSAESLAKGLEHFFSLNAEEKQAMGEHARKNVCDRFDISKTIRQWPEVFKSRGIEI